MIRSTLLVLAAISAFAADNLPPQSERQLARDIYKEMIEVQSGFSTGATTPIAESVAARLKAAGFPESDIFVGGPNPASQTSSFVITEGGNTSRSCC